MPRRAARSPYGPEDELGALNRLTPEGRRSILSRADGARLYDLSVDFFIGMPSYRAGGDPLYQIWMTHTPAGTEVDDASGAGKEANRQVSYSGDAILMYTHTGTHIDALNHFGYSGEIFNRFRAADHLGSRHWQKAGADRISPLVARGILVDVAASMGVDCLPESFGISAADLEAALRRQGSQIEPGDVVLVRTGRIGLWPDSGFIGRNPGLTLEAAEWLAERGVVAVGADNDALEQLPSTEPDNWLPVHCFLLAEAGVYIFEILDLQELARDKVYEFCFVAAPLKLRGATAAPARPIAFPLLEA